MLVPLWDPQIETVTPLGHDDYMTQLFDTETYEELTELDGSPAAGRHLRSMPTGSGLDLPGRSTQWRLDARTIEVGRKGIQAARQALQDAAKANGNTNVRRKAA